MSLMTYPDHVIRQFYFLSFTGDARLPLVHQRRQWLRKESHKRQRSYTASFSGLSRRLANVLLTKDDKLRHLLRCSGGSRVQRGSLQTLSARSLGASDTCLSRHKRRTRRQKYPSSNKVSRKGSPNCRSARSITPNNVNTRPVEPSPAAVMPLSMQAHQAPFNVSHPQLPSPAQPPQNLPHHRPIKSLKRLLKHAPPSSISPLLPSIYSTATSVPTHIYPQQPYSCVREDIEMVVVLPVREPAPSMNIYNCGRPRWSNHYDSMEIVESELQTTTCANVAPLQASYPTSIGNSSSQDSQYSLDATCITSTEPPSDGVMVNENAMMSEQALHIQDHQTQDVLANMGDIEMSNPGLTADSAHFPSSPCRKLPFCLRTSKEVAYPARFQPYSRPKKPSAPRRSCRGVPPTSLLGNGTTTPVQIPGTTSPVAAQVLEPHCNVPLEAVACGGPQPPTQEQGNEVNRPCEIRSSGGTGEPTEQTQHLPQSLALSLDYSAPPSPILAYAHVDEHTVDAFLSSIPLPSIESHNVDEQAPPLNINSSGAPSRQSSTLAALDQSTPRCTASSTTLPREPAGSDQDSESDTEEEATEEESDDEWNEDLEIPTATPSVPGDRRVINHALRFPGRVGFW